MNNLKRRDFLKTAAGSAAMFGLTDLECWANSLVGDEVRKNLPNIVLIMSDDTGIGENNCNACTKSTASRSAVAMGATISASPM